VRRNGVLSTNERRNFPWNVNTWVFIGNCVYHTGVRVLHTRGRRLIISQYGSIYDSAIMKGRIFCFVPSFSSDEIKQKMRRFMFTFGGYDLLVVMFD